MGSSLRSPHRTRPRFGSHPSTTVPGRRRRRKPCSHSPARPCTDTRWGTSWSTRPHSPSRSRCRSTHCLRNSPARTVRRCRLPTGSPSAEDTAVRSRILPGSPHHSPPRSRLRSSFHHCTQPAGTSRRHTHPWSSLCRACTLAPECTPNRLGPRSPRPTRHRSSGGRCTPRLRTCSWTTSTIRSCTSRHTHCRSAPRRRAWRTPRRNRCLTPIRRACRWRKDPGEPRWCCRPCRSQRRMPRPIRSTILTTM